MKKLLIGLFLVSSVLAFSQRVVKGSQAYDEKGVVYIQGEKTPYTGVLQNINEKGILESEAEYKDGKMNGFSKLYYPNGKLGSEATFKDNVQDGLQKDYFEDGKVKLEIPYKNGKVEGTAKEFYPNGKLFVEATYKNAIKDSYEKSYYETGVLQSEKL